MLNRIILALAILAPVTAVTAAGCGSSSTSNGGGPEEGGASSSSGSSSGGTGSSGGDATSSSSSGGTSSSSSSGGTGSSSGGMDGSSLACPPSTGDAGAYQSGTYTNATADQGLCKAADITTFMTDCVTGANVQTTCPTWLGANVAGAMKGGKGTACGNCIFAPKDNGGVFVDGVAALGQGQFGADYGACIQLTDKTNGPTCAPAWDNYIACHDYYCGSCMSQSDFDACTAAADQAGCSSEATAFGTSCASDAQLTDAGLAIAKSVAACFPSIKSGKVSDDIQYTVTLICGGGGG